MEHDQINTNYQIIRDVFKPNRYIKFANAKCEYLLFHVEQEFIDHVYIKLKKYIWTDYQKWFYKNQIQTYTTIDNIVDPAIL